MKIDSNYFDSALNSDFDLYLAMIWRSVAKFSPKNDSLDEWILFILDISYHIKFLNNTYIRCSF